MLMMLAVAVILYAVGLLVAARVLSARPRPSPPPLGPNLAGRTPDDRHYDAWPPVAYRGRR